MTITASALYVVFGGAAAWAAASCAWPFVANAGSISSTPATTIPESRRMCISPRKSAGILPYVETQEYGHYFVGKKHSCPAQLQAAVIIDQQPRIDEPLQLLPVLPPYIHAVT